MIRAVVHASEILTGAGIRAKDGRRVSDADLGRIEDGAIVYEEAGRARGQRSGGRSGGASKILWVGATRELPREFRRAKRVDLKRRQAVVPGLIDCHTHLVFSGDRADEFARRSAGASYEEIAAQGGGIVATVRATRRASKTELLRLAVERVEKSRSYGVRTLEIKSGYGLDLATEIKILEVVRQLRKRFPDMTFQATFMGAHAFPPQEDGVSRERYMSELLEKMLPEVARKKLADACDIFVDAGYFTPEQARALFAKARSLGLATKIHADELGDTGSAALASELDCLSADHLLKISGVGIQKLALSDTVAVLLPGTAFYLKAAHAPARKLIDAGACVALSTDFNPGTCMTLNLQAVMTIAALYLGMSRAEILAAVTYNAAKALALHGRKGTLAPGMDADFAVLPVARFEELYYRFAW